MHRAGLIGVVLLVSGVAHASRTVSGTVFVDRDGNGLLSAPDQVFTDGVVFWEIADDAPIDELGGYALSVPDGAGIVWVRARDGLDPGPFWAEVPEGGDRTIDIAVKPVSVTGELSFVVASDTHAGIAGMPARDQAFALQQATNLEPRPHFIAVTGDITQSNRPEQFETVLDAIAVLGTPYVPVPGNHDWYDGGAAYRRAFGPPSYAFSAGGVHFIVLNDADSLDARVAFVDRDLSLLDGEPTVVALMHAPPGDDLVRALAERGVDRLFTGHLHANRLLVHGSLVEYNTQPLAMAGLDLTPAGYRVVSLGGGALQSEHRTIVARPVLRILSPAADQIMEPCRVPVLVALAVGEPVTSIAARVEGLGRVPLAPVGGWTHASAPLELCEPGVHRIDVEVALASGEVLTDSVAAVVGEPEAAGEIRDWPMLQGSPAHAGWSPIETGFPLRTRWVAAVGGHVHGGSPVVADGRVFAAVSDFAAGAAGGVVALDAATGRLLWEQRVGSSVRNAPAVADGVVVFAASDGTLHAADAATGDPIWTAALAPGEEAAARTIYSAPTIAGGVVYAGGRSELVALDLHTGEVVWSAVPADSPSNLGSHASPAVAQGLVVVAFDRGEGGLIAFDADTGERRWQTGREVTQGVQGSPAIAGDAVYVVNELTQVTALDLEDGSVRWSTRLDETGFDWAYRAVATPAYHDGVLFIGTQLGVMFALDSASGRTMWSADAAETSLVRTTHYRGEVPAFGAAPALTPGLVWAGSPDGMLRALHARDGRELWSLDLGVPITASPVPAGSLMFVASFDGTVRALTTSPEVELPRPGGCAVGSPPTGTAAALAALLLLRTAIARGRRRRGDLAVRL